MLAYFLAVCFYNVSGLVLCGCTSALHRTIYDSLRSITTWAASVFVYYTWGGGDTLAVVAREARGVRTDGDRITHLSENAHVALPEGRWL
jgi:hypothetical protein